MSDTRKNLKQRAAHELREYLLISLYLWVVFAIFVVYKSLILAEHHIDYTRHGFAVIEALALAKVMLTAQDLHLGDWLGDAPLIHVTLLKSFVFTVVLACFKIVEDFLVGKLHGKSFQESIADFGGGTWKGIVTLSLLVCIMLIPFFGFTELRRVFGPDRLLAVFFQPRRLWNLPANED
ncbi:MAG TPA: hypothetical protein VF772_27850 [Terriglobales bacterium]